MQTLPPLYERFIETEAVERSGQEAELEVWRSIKSAFKQRECFSFWRFPVFVRGKGARKEPDILLVDRQLGLVILEVKALRIEQIETIQGHRWSYKGFREVQGNPYEQAERQMWQLLDHFTAEPSLHKRVTARVMVALPHIRRDEWMKRGFHHLAAQPPILFFEDLNRPTEAIEQSFCLQSGPPLDQQRWERLQKVLLGKTLFIRNPQSVTARQGRAAALEQSRQHLYALDLQQEKISKQIPPGPQRIRGIAGSGKTVMLCQKAAIMHLRYPNWNIALTFFTQSLYDTILRQLDLWLRHYSGGELGYDPTNPKLKVLHAWGRWGRTGLYREIARQNGLRFYHPGNIPKLEQGSPLSTFAWATRQLLLEAKEKNQVLKPIFDVILVDEGQDLVFEPNHKFDGKQPFYWMAWQSLRPATSEPNNLFDTSEIETLSRRLIWAYDEAQSLDSLTIPTSKELFGAGFERMVSGSYQGGILKSEVMRNCYRTPRPILVAAHALGMGLLRPQGVISSISNLEGWHEIGYEAKGNFHPPGQEVLLHRTEHLTPNPIPRLWNQPLLTFEAHPGRFEEITSLVNRVKQDLADGMSPSREIMVVVLGDFREARSIIEILGRELNRARINYYLPKASQPNSFDSEGDASQFWFDGAVTITQVARAKGNEAEVVYVLGLDAIARREAAPEARNELFVALTRSRGFAHLSGIGSYTFYKEVQQVLQSGPTFRFIYRKLKRELSEEAL